MNKLVIFDLDGTLIDSLGDLADSMNEVLTTLGYPTHPEDAYRTKVGDGVGNLILRSLPPGTITPQRVEDCKVRMREAYAKRLTRRTRPYPGIVNMLVGVRERGARVAVFSNKPDPATREICAVLFNGHPFAFVLGATATLPLKPDPAGVHHILKATATEPAGRPDLSLLRILHPRHARGARRGRVDRPHHQHHTRRTRAGRLRPRSMSLHRVHPPAPLARHPDEPQRAALRHPHSGMLLGIGETPRAKAG